METIKRYIFIFSNNTSLGVIREHVSIYSCFEHVLYTNHALATQSVNCGKIKRLGAT